MLLLCSKGCLTISFLGQTVESSKLFLVCILKQLLCITLCPLCLKAALYKRKSRHKAHIILRKYRCLSDWKWKNIYMEKFSLKNSIFFPKQKIVVKVFSLKKYTNFPAAKTRKKEKKTQKGKAKRKGKCSWIFWREPVKMFSLFLQLCEWGKFKRKRERKSENRKISTREEIFPQNTASDRVRKSDNVYSFAEFPGTDKRFFIYQLQQQLNGTQFSKRKQQKQKIGKARMLQRKTKKIISHPYRQRWKMLSKFCNIFSFWENVYLPSWKSL